MFNARSSFFANVPTLCVSCFHISLRLSVANLENPKGERAPMISNFFSTYSTKLLEHKRRGWGGGRFCPLGST